MDLIFKIGIVLNVILAVTATILLVLKSVYGKNAVITFMNKFFAGKTERVRILKNASLIVIIYWLILLIPFIDVLVQAEILTDLQTNGWLLVYGMFKLSPIEGGVSCFAVFCGAVTFTFAREAINYSSILKKRKLRRKDLSFEGMKSHGLIWSMTFFTLI